MDGGSLTLRYDAGSLLLEGGDDEYRQRLPGCRFDPRVNRHRTEGRHYRPIVEMLRADKVAYVDQVREYQPVVWELRSDREPYPHQIEGLQTWWRQRGEGVVVLPTGTGKTFLAMLAIQKAGRPALVVTPTIDLLNQWYG